MENELTMNNIDKVTEALKGVKGKTIMIGDTFLEGVVSIEIKAGKEYLNDSCTDEGADGEEIDVIHICFNFEGGGYATKSFEPDMKVCRFSFETDTLWAVLINDIKTYVEREKFDLDFRLEQYEKFMEQPSQAGTDSLTDKCEDISRRLYGENLNRRLTANGHKPFTNKEIDSILECM